MIIRGGLSCFMRIIVTYDRYFDLRISRGDYSIHQDIKYSIEHR